MPTKEKRFTIVLNRDLDKQLSELKKKIFYDKSQSEMIRQILAVGLSHINSRK